MINRYEGNTGRVLRMPEAGDLRPPPPPFSPPPPPPRPGPQPRYPLCRLFSGLEELESGDTELLLIMAAAFLF